MKAKRRFVGQGRNKSHLGMADYLVGRVPKFSMRTIENQLTKRLCFEITRNIRRMCVIVLCAILYENA